MAFVTHHAAVRYTERVEPCDVETARLRILSAQRVIDRAAAFGCSTIVMGNGARLVLDGTSVVTVLSARKGKRPGWMA